MATFLPCLHLNFAVTLRFWPITKRQGFLSVQAPDQPVKWWRLVAAALNVTVVPGP